MAVLLVAATLLPLALLAAYDVKASRQQFMTATEALLAARADGLVRQIDAFNANLRLSAERLAQMPRVTSYAAPSSDDRATPGAAELLELWRASDPNLRGLGLLDPGGVVRLATEPSLVGKNLSFRRSVQQASRGQFVSGDIFVEETAAGSWPTVAYLAPVRDAAGRVAGMVALWARAESLWRIMRSANALAGPGSYAVVLDQQGIRLGHSFNDEVVFHPAGPLDGSARGAVLAERRFGERTAALLDEVRSFPAIFDRARTPNSSAGLFSGYGPVNQQWNYGVARHAATAPWTVCYLLPQSGLETQIASLTRTKVVFAAVIMLCALGAGILFGGAVLNPIRALAQATEAVAAGDLSVRVPVWPHGDELGRLGQNFNLMVDQIESHAANLVHSRDQLDKRVTERTAELLRSTQALQAEVAERSRAQAELEAQESRLTTALHAAEQSRARMAALFDSGIIGVVVGTLDGRIVEINDSLATMLGYTREEILTGQVRWPTLTPPEWQLGDLRAIETLRRRGAIPVREKEYLHKDGHRIPALVGTAILSEPTNEAIAFVLDVTHNREAAVAIEHLREVRASEAQFRALLEAVPDGVIITDSDGAIVFVNGQAEQLFGYERANLIGKPVEILIPERFREVHPAYRRGYSTAPLVRAMGAKRELYGRREDASEVPVEVSLSPLQTEKGLLVISSIRDISERRRADEARFRLAAIVESSGDAIIGKTLDGVITSWNEAAGRIFGYGADEIVGKSITVIIPADRLHEEKEILAKLGKGERIEQFDTVRLRKDGKEIHVSLTSSPVRDSNGRLVGASKIARDITERRRAESALAQAKDLAEAASRELEAFSYSVAHDLRAPLRGMNGFAHVLLDSYREKLDADGQDYLQEIVLNAKKMGELIDALLSLARVTRSDLKMEILDLSALARDIIAQHRLLDPARDVEVCVEDGLVAEMDPRLARALLDNLLANAWKFTSRAPKARIEVEGTRREGAVTVSIRDNGAGFDMSYVNKLFAPFQRLHSGAEFAGTGIGLATSQRIVHRHGGRIWADGSVGHGATFHFTIPSRAGRLS